jgi:gas vesicle protein
MGIRGYGTMAIFIGGVFAGLMLSPKTGKENRAIFLRSAKKLSGWLDNNTRQIRFKTSVKAHHIADNMKKNAIPDLYEATGTFNLDDQDIFDSLR